MEKSADFNFQHELTLKLQLVSKNIYILVITNLELCKSKQKNRRAIYLCLSLRCQYIHQAKCQWNDRVVRAACGVSTSEWLVLELTTGLTDWEPICVSDEGISSRNRTSARPRRATPRWSDCWASLLQQPAPPPSVTPATPSVAALSPLIARIPRREFFCILPARAHWLACVNRAQFSLS